MEEDICDFIQKTQKPPNKEIWQLPIENTSNSQWVTFRVSKELFPTQRWRTSSPIWRSMGEGRWITGVSMPGLDQAWLGEVNLKRQASSPPCSPLSVSQFFKPAGHFLSRALYIHCPICLDCSPLLPRLTLFVSFRFQTEGFALGEAFPSPCYVKSAPL